MTFDGLVGLVLLSCLLLTVNIINNTKVFAAVPEGNYTNW